METLARIVYLETEDRCDILLTKKPYADFREIGTNIRKEHGFLSRRYGIFLPEMKRFYLQNEERGAEICPKFTFYRKISRS